MSDDAVISTVLMTNHISTCHSMWTNRIITTGHLKLHNSYISKKFTVCFWVTSFGVKCPYLFEHRIGSSSRGNDYVQHYVIYCLHSE